MYHMKFGFRKPSLKKSFSARTSGLFTRSIKRALLPGYGKKGVGWLTNPKKSLYNRVYRSLTVGLSDVLSMNSHTCNPSMNTPSMTMNQFFISKRTEGLRQCDEVLQFTSQYILDSSLILSILNALYKIRGRTNRYLNKGSKCQDDLYQYITNEIKALRETAKRESTRYECSIVLDIIEQLRVKTEPSQIIDSIKSKYPLWQASDEKNNNSSIKYISVLKELQNNIDAKTESEKQKEMIYGLSGLVIKNIRNLEFMNSWIKILSNVEKHSARQIPLFDYLLYVLEVNSHNVKRETTKREYRLACEIIQFIKNNQTLSIDRIFELLRDRYI